MSYRYGKKTSAVAVYGKKSAWPIIKRDKYSIETTFVNQTITAIPSGATSAATISFKVVNPVTVQGMRKVKHLEVTLAGNTNSRVVWALVYVPQVDLSLANLTLNTDNASSLYEPNQFVMMSGTTDFAAGMLRFRTPMARNLNSGDAIVLLLKNLTSVDVTVSGTIRYAITLQ